MKPCPNCNIELKPKMIGLVEIDECEKCKGIWFDKDELRQVKDITDSDLNWMDFEIWRHLDKIETQARNLKCPKCEQTLVAIKYGETDITIDYCPNCKGTWLDSDEFKKIIASLELELQTKSFSEYLTSSLQEAKEIISGPESISSEWKDLSTVIRLMQYRLFLENPRLLDNLIEIQKGLPIQ